MSNGSEHTPEYLDYETQCPTCDAPEPTHTATCAVPYRPPSAAAEREELFQLWLRHGSSFESDHSEGYELADALLAAGWRKVGDRG